VVNLARLEQLYPAGGEVTVADLVAKGAVRKGQPVKVLGQGKLTVKLTVADDIRVSAAAGSQITQLGGSYHKE